MLGLEDVGERPDEAGFERVYRDHYAFVWRCARRMGVATHDLDDVLQDTFVAAYRRFDSWDRRSRATTWLFGILRNVLRNRSRGQRRHDRRLAALTHVEQGHTAPRGELAGETLLAGQLLRSFLATLDHDKRAVFVLAELEGHTALEIGRALAISHNTASSRLRLARAAFDRHFDHAARQRVERATRREREQPEQPPPGASERTLALVLAAPGTTTLAAGGGLVGTLGLGKLALAAGLGLATLGAASLDVSASPRELAPAASLAAPAQVPAGPRRAAAPAATSIDTEHDELAIDVVALPPARSHAAAPPPTGPSKLDAYEALRHARELVLAHDGERALAVLDAIGGTELHDARTATRIAALCQLGRHDEAERHWTRLHQHDADSPLVEQLREACWTTR
jgi:RNA polymerase sigma factor (sigma-70 family)